MKNIILLASLLALCNLTLFGQTALHTARKPAIQVPPQAVPAGLKTIYTNLGPSNNFYSTTQSWLVAGPNSGVTEFEGLLFIPKSNSHVSEVRVAMQYLGSGANQINISIYGDSNGAPGTLLAGPVTVTNLPQGGTCCTLGIADFSPVAVTAGTRYWVVADTPLTGTGSDFFGEWEWVSKASVLWAGDQGGAGWYQVASDGLPAGAVLGTIP